MPPPWEVIYDEDYSAWFQELDQDLQDAILTVVTMLELRGPMLGRPYADTLKGAPLKNLKELRVQHRGQPWRILFAFDPERRAVLLLGGNKGGDGRWYEKNIPLAVERARRHSIE